MSKTKKSAGDSPKRQKAVAATQSEQQAPIPADKTGYFERISMGKKIIYVFFSCIVWGTFFYALNDYYTPKKERLSFQDQLVKLSEKEVNRALISSISNSGSQFLNGHSLDVTNILEPGQSYSVAFYLNSEKQFFRGEGEKEAPITGAEPIWRLNGCTYVEAPEQLSEFDYELTDSQIEAVVAKKETLYLHMQLSAENQMRNPNNKVARFHFLQEKWPQAPVQDVWVLNLTLALVEWRAQPNYSQTKHVLDLVQTLISGGEEAASEVLEPHIKPDVTAHIVFDDEVYAALLSDANQYLKSFVVTDHILGLYIPIVHTCDFWEMPEDLIPVSLNMNRKLKLRFGNQDKQKFINHQRYQLSMLNMAQVGLANPGDETEFKRMYKAHDIVTLGITAVLAFGYLISMMVSAFEDFQFWRNLSSLDGVSVQSLFLEFEFMCFTWQYYVQTEASKFLMIPLVIQIAIQIFKLSNSVKSFGLPWLKIEHVESYKEKTKAVDDRAMPMTYAILIVGFVSQIVYHALVPHATLWTYATLVTGYTIALFGWGLCYPAYCIFRPDAQPSEANKWRFLAIWCRIGLTLMGTLTSMQRADMSAYYFVQFLVWYGQTTRKVKQA